MLYLLGGFAILGGLLMLVYLFVNADPARLARNLKWTGITIAGIAVAALILLPPAREFAALLLPLAMATPLLARIRTVLDRHRPPSGGHTSTVGTAFLRLRLDHDHPEWRDELAGERAGGDGTGTGARSTSSGDMSVEEAYAILGLSAGA